MNLKSLSKIIISMLVIATQESAFSQQVSGDVDELKVSGPSDVGNLNLHMARDSRSGDSLLVYESQSKRCQVPGDGFEIKGGKFKADTNMDMSLRYSRSGNVESVTVTTGNYIVGMQGEQDDNAKITAGPGGVIRESCFGLCFSFGGDSKKKRRQQAIDAIANDPVCQGTSELVGRVKLPEVPKFVPAYYGVNRVLVGFTELVPGSKIFVGSRHALQGHDEQTASYIRKSLEQYLVLESKVNGQRQDIVFVVHADTITKLKRKKTSLADYLSKKDRLVLAQPGDVFVSFMTAFDERTGSSSQLAHGQIMRVDQNYLYVLNTESSFATKSSSGSLIYSSTSKDLSDRSNESWKPTGILQCFYPDRTDSSGVKHPPQYRVLQLKSILESEISLVDLEQLFDENRPNLEDGCIPFDGRDGGGG